MPTGISRSNQFSASLSHLTIRWRGRKRGDGWPATSTVLRLGLTPTQFYIETALFAIAVERKQDHRDYLFSGIELSFWPRRKRAYDESRYIYTKQIGKVFPRPEWERIFANGGVALWEHRPVTVEGK